MTPTYFIPKDVIGSQAGIVVEDGRITTESNTPPNDSLVLNQMVCNELSSLCGSKARKFIPDNHLAIYSKLGIKNPEKDVPWKMCLPKSEYQNILENFVNSINNTLASDDADYYFKYFKPTNMVFDALKPAKINKTTLDAHLKNSNDSQSSLLKSFNPSGPLGFCPAPRYDRIHTITGRLSIEDGPKILTLKKEYRDIIESRFGDEGRIVYVDYKNLEPRSVLAIRGAESRNEYDIYDYFIKNYELDVPRNIVKHITIARLYGAGHKLLKHQIESGFRGVLADNQIDELIELVDQHFGIKTLIDDVKTQYDNNNREFIKNLYGRTMRVSGIVGDNVLMNYFVQSTAVDIALLGFKNIIEGIKRKNDELIVPLYILHDALILDVHKDAKNDLISIIPMGMKVDKVGDTKFHLDISTLG